jgi:Flp pilus assembly protein TadG
MIMFGTIQFGIAFNRYQGLNAGAREAARLASVGGTYTDVFQRVKDSVSTIDTSTAISPCNPDPPTTAGILCVNISTVTSGGALTQVASSTTVPPCVTAAITNPAAPVVDVQAKYKMAMAIPFVAGFQPVLTGEGRFRCES